MQDGNRMGCEGERERGCFHTFRCFGLSRNGRSEVTFCYHSGVTWEGDKEDTVQSKQASLPGSCRLLAGPSTRGHASCTCTVDTLSPGRVHIQPRSVFLKAADGHTSTIPVAFYGVTGFPGIHDWQPLGGGRQWEPAVGVCNGEGQSQTDRSRHLRERGD